MRDALLLAGLSAAVAGLITNLLVPLVARLAVAVRAVDYPGERKLQAGAVPRLGGLAIVLGLALGGGASPRSRWGEWGGQSGRSEMLALAFGTAMVFLVGLIDDLLGVSSPKKFLVQLVAALPAGAGRLVVRGAAAAAASATSSSACGARSSRCSGSSASPTRST